MQEGVKMASTGEGSEHGTTLVAVGILESGVGTEDLRRDPPCLQISHSTRHPSFEAFPKYQQRFIEQAGTDHVYEEIPPDNQPSGGQRTLALQPSNQAFLKNKHPTLQVQIFVSAFGHDGRALCTIAIGYGVKPTLRTSIVNKKEVQMHGIFRNELTINTPDALNRDILMKIYADDDVSYSSERPEGIYYVSDWEKAVFSDENPIKLNISDGCVETRSAVIHSRNRKIESLSLGVSYANGGDVEDIAEFSFLEENESNLGLQD
eukprot:scpid77310/ scgid29911/ 